MKSILLGVVVISVCGFGALFAEEEFTPIFDGKSLDGWSSGRNESGGGFGPFRINEEEGAIHVYKGEEAGSKQEKDCLYTEKEFSRYTLRLEYKWGEARFAPRVDWDRDAGLLFHVHGNVGKVWPSCMEMQIGETLADVSLDNIGRRFHTGDLYVLGKGLECMTRKVGKVYSAESELVESRNCMTVLGIERARGEWNEMEIVVDGAKKVTFKLNGEVVHEIENLRKVVDGKVVPLERGRIGLQAEWAELMYRNIRVKEME